jgi:DNA-binding transcriptional regulator GbsR (MarR family)
MKLNEGSQAHKVWNALLEHEYMKLEKIAKRTGISESKLSTSLTKLRRAGLASANGAWGSRQWKRYPIAHPRFPPQPDFMKRKNSRAPSKAAKVEASPVDIIKHIIDCLGDLQESIVRERITIREDVKQQLLEKLR